jgi:hypothetical protein
MLCALKVLNVGSKHRFNNLPQRLNTKLIQARNKAVIKAGTMPYFVAYWCPSSTKDEPLARLKLGLQCIPEKDCRPVEPSSAFAQGIENLRSIML